MNFFHSFAAVPVTHGTEVDVAGAIVDVATTTSDEPDEHADRRETHASARGSKRFMAFTKLGHALHVVWE